MTMGAWTIGQELQVVVSVQTLRFCMSMVLGLGLGALYDVFRILRLAIPHPTAVVFLEDIGYWCAVGLSAQLLFYYTDQGFFRLYLLLGIGIGFVVYYFTIGTIVMRTAGAIIDGIRRIFAGFICKIRTPIIKQAGQITKKVKNTVAQVRIVKKTYIKTWNRTKKTKNALAKQDSLLYNQKKDAGD